MGRMRDEHYEQQITRRAPCTQEMRKLYPEMLWEVSWYRWRPGTHYVLIPNLHSKGYGYKNTTFTSDDAGSPREVRSLMIVKEIQFLAGMLT